MTEKKITNDVTIETYDESLGGADVVCHYCEGTTSASGSRLMISRENDDGPMYWCTGCGYTLDEGVAMAVRLNEVDI
jgi:hypothetical protein